MRLITLPLGHLATNAYFLINEADQRAALVDAPAEPETILDFLKENHLTLTDIVLTHGHFDHILALKALKEATGAKVSAHRNTAEFLRNTDYNLCRYAGVSWTPMELDHTLSDGDEILLGGLDFRIIETPGHTEDCICLYHKGTLLSGDTLFRRSIGRTDHPTGDTTQEIASIQNKLMLLPDETVVYPGHGASTTIGEERRENPYLS